MENLLLCHENKADPVKFRVLPARRERKWRMRREVWYEQRSAGLSRQCGPAVLPLVALRAGPLLLPNAIPKEEKLSCRRGVCPLRVVAAKDAPRADVNEFIPGLS